MRTSDLKPRGRAASLFNSPDSSLEQWTQNPNSAKAKTLLLSKDLQRKFDNEENHQNQVLYAEIEQILKQRNANQSKEETIRNTLRQKPEEKEEQSAESSVLDTQRANKMIIKLKERMGFFKEHKEIGFDKHMRVFKKLDTYINATGLIKDLADPVKHSEILEKRKSEPLAVSVEAQKIFEEKDRPVMQEKRLKIPSQFHITPVRIQPSDLRSLDSSPTNPRNHLGTLAEIPSPGKSTRRSHASSFLPSIEMTIAEKQAQINQALLNDELESMRKTKQSLHDKSVFQKLVAKLEGTELASTKYPEIKEGPDDFNFEKKLEKNLLRDIFTKPKSVYERTKEELEEAIAMKKLQSVRKVDKEVSPKQHHKEFTRAADKVVKLVSSKAKKIYFDHHPEDRDILEKIARRNRLDREAQQQKLKKKTQLLAGLPKILKHRSMPNLELGSELFDASAAKEQHQPKESAFLTGLVDLSRIQSERSHNNSSCFDRSDAAVLDKKESAGKPSSKDARKSKKMSVKTLSTILNPQVSSNLLNSSAETRATLKFRGSGSKSQLDIGRFTPNSFLNNEKAKSKICQGESSYREEYTRKKQSLRSFSLAPLPAKRLFEEKRNYRSKFHSLLDMAQQVNVECGMEAKQLQKSISINDAYYEKKLKDVQRWSDINPAELFDLKEESAQKKKFMKKRLNRHVLSKLLD